MKTAMILAILTFSTVAHSEESVNKETLIVSPPIIMPSELVKQNEKVPGHPASPKV